jgi:hypothetical protein
MKKYTIEWAEMQNPVCHWVNVFLNGNYIGRILVGAKGSRYEQTKKSMIEEYFNSIAISNMFS